MLRAVDALEYSRRGVAEFIGTFALIFIGATAGLYNDLVATALAHGLVIAVFVSAFAGISGGHFNPAVTLGFLVTRRIPACMAVFYWIVQFGAAALAALLLKWILPRTVETSSHLGAPTVNAAITSGKARDDRGGLHVLPRDRRLRDRRRRQGRVRQDRRASRSASRSRSAILMAGPLTGGAINPARAFGPELVSGYWKNAWVWYVGPLAGGALAAILYELLYLSRPYHDEEIGAPAELYTPEDVSDAVHDPEDVVIAEVPEPASSARAGAARRRRDEPPASTPRNRFR